LVVGDSGRVEAGGTDVHWEVRLIGHELFGLRKVDEGADSGCEEFIKFLGRFIRGPGILAGNEKWGSPIRVWDWSWA